MAPLKYVYEVTLRISIAEGKDVVEVIHVIAASLNEAITKSGEKNKMVIGIKLVAEIDIE